MSLTRKHALPLLLVVALPGCATPNNDRLSIGTSENPVWTPPAVRAGEPLAPAAGPSLMGLDRSAWPEIDFVVANDATEQYPHLTRLRPAFDRGTARARGEFPTAISAVEGEGGFWAIVGEGFLWPGYVVTDGALAIPRAIEADRLSPMESYERGAPGFGSD